MYKLTLALAALLPTAAAVAQQSTPCGILTKADIQEAVGKAPADGKLDPRNNRVCHFKLEEPNTVTIGLEAVTPANASDKALAEFKKSNTQVQLVPGLGDRAFFLEAFGMTTLSVYKGPKVLSVVVFIMGTPPAKVKAMAEKLARKAVPRM